MKSRQNMEATMGLAVSSGIELFAGGRLRTQSLAALSLRKKAVYPFDKKGLHGPHRLLARGPQIRIARNAKGYSYSMR